MANSYCRPTFPTSCHNLTISSSFHSPTLSTSYHELTYPASYRSPAFLISYNGTTISKEYDYTAPFNDSAFMWQPFVDNEENPLPSSRPQRDAYGVQIDNSRKTSYKSSEDYRRTKNFYAAQYELEEKEEEPEEPWSPRDIECLVRMKDGGMSWTNILRHFPERTMTSIQQVYFRYRSM
ncbi:hypothetical protein V8C42DRAFT_197855 [Trichoderma barbatum]